MRSGCGRRPSTTRSSTSVSSCLTWSRRWRSFKSHWGSSGEHRSTPPFRFSDRTVWWRRTSTRSTAKVALPRSSLSGRSPGPRLPASGGVSFHHLGFWTDRLADSSHHLGAHGWPCAVTVASAENKPSRFTLQQSPHGFYVELFDTATPRHTDLLPKPSDERADDEHH